MKQFILNKEPDNNIVRLDGKDYRYLVKVRRLAAGEFFPALLPDGSETLIKILSVDHNVLTGHVEKKSTNNSSLRALEPSCLRVNQIILFQALPKGEKMDLIVRQAAEGGITEIVPFTSDFSIAKPSSSQKFSRWERIIKEARQQSGSKIPTKISKILTKEELFTYWGKLKENGGLGLLFHHQGLAQNSLHSYLDSNPHVVALAVGPEGGFSDAETAAFMENGFKPFTIGDTVLRTETAALYCAAAVRILLLEKDSWKLNQANSGSE
jgi:16S rRNA (uracil1498-N3)-methyltransferase